MTSSGGCENKISLGRKELEAFASQDLGFYGLDISRISMVFLAQVLQFRVHRTIDTFCLLDEVKYLERLKSSTATKAVETFKHQPLKGLKKKHFFNAAFVLENMNAHWGFSYGGNKRLDEVINEAFDRNATGYVDEELCGFLAHAMTFGALENRNQGKGLTGEWIVFQEYEGKNFYLTIAAHTEDDQAIFCRVQDAWELDFPFLKAAK